MVEAIYDEACRGPSSDQVRNGIHSERVARLLGGRWFAAIALAGAILIAGCGGSSGRPSASTVRGSTISASSDAPGVAADVGFAKCMRANRVPSFPDPDASGNFSAASGTGPDPPSPAFRAANNKCAKLWPHSGALAFGGRTHPSARSLGHWLKITQCMRRHGVSHFPDPTTKVPSSMAGVGLLAVFNGVIFVFPAALDEQSPVLTHAAAVCKFPLPRG